jgi:hypothetical protein
LNRSRLHEADLRTSDPVTLEVRLAEVLRRPIVQLTVATVVDICALADVESLPKNFRQSLRLFADKVPQQVNDLPNGEPVETFVTELGSIAAARVPMSIRSIAAREAAHTSRSDFVREQFQLVAEAWADAPVDPITLGTQRPKVQNLAPMEAPAEPVRHRSAAAASAPKPKAPLAAKASTPSRPVDVDRRNRVIELVLERLQDYPETGLREDVLVAGIRHRARADYPDLTTSEIGGVLKDLESAKRVSGSAGRWKRRMGSW